MTTRCAPRDWLESAPEYEAPTDEEVQLEVNMIAGSYGRSRRESGAGDDWNDHAED
jgi:hypothetical protein